VLPARCRRAQVLGQPAGGGRAQALALGLVQGRDQRADLGRAREAELALLADQHLRGFQLREGGEEGLLVQAHQGRQPGQVGLGTQQGGHAAHALGVGRQFREARVLRHLPAAGQLEQGLVASHPLPTLAAQRPGAHPVAQHGLDGTGQPARDHQQALRQAFGQLVLAQERARHRERGVLVQRRQRQHARALAHGLRRQDPAPGRAELPAHRDHGFPAGAPARAPGGRGWGRAGR